MKKDIKWFIKRGQIVQDDSFKHLSKRFLEKSICFYKIPKKRAENITCRMAVMFL